MRGVKFGVQSAVEDVKRGDSEREKSRYKQDHHFCFRFVQCMLAVIFCGRGLLEHNSR